MAPARSWIWVLFGVAAVVLAAYFARLGLIRPDESYNLQVAKSLAAHFTYARIYEPAVVYDPRITTNGPMQYAGALLFALGLNVIGVITVISVLGMTLFAIGLWLLRPWLTTLAVALFLIWPYFFKSATNFLGDVWAVAFALVGIALLERVLARRDLREAMRSPLFTASAIFLAAAVSTKLVMAVLIAPLVFAVAVRARRSPLAVTFLTLAIVAVLFMLQFSFSVLHSTGGDAARVLPTLEHFVGEHRRQAGARVALNNAGLRLHYFSSPLILWGALAASIALALEWPASIALAGIVWALLLYYGLTERELVPAFTMLLVFGFRSMEGLCAGALRRWPVPTAWRAAIAAAVLAVLPAASGTVIGGPVFWMVPAGERQSVAYTQSAIYHYHRSFIREISDQRYVATTGWSQFPEIAILHGFTFYDRLAPANAHLPRGQVALLFAVPPPQGVDPDGIAYRRTTIAANCSGIIARDGPLVLCRPRTDVPLSYVTR